MKAQELSNRPTAEECRQLVTLLDLEEENYRRLLRLAWRQNSYMRRQDVDRLEANARDWARHLPAANAARMARERLVGRIGSRYGIEITPENMGQLLAWCAAGHRARIQTALRRLKLTTAKLARQNELNRNLAEFCLDLAHEETEIFKRCVTDNPTGCYGDDARTAKRGPGGVIVRQA